MAFPASLPTSFPHAINQPPCEWIVHTSALHNWGHKLVQPKCALLREGGTEEEIEKEMFFLCLEFSGPARVGRAKQGWGEAGKNQELDGYPLCASPRPHYIWKAGLLSADGKEKPPE